MNRDKRRYHRIPIKADFFIKDDSLSETGELYFASQNVSIGGAFLLSDFLLASGSEFRVRFQLPGEESMEAKAKVAWVSDGDEGEPGMGIAFTTISPEHMAAIQRFIRRSNGIPA